MPNDLIKIFIMHVKEIFSDDAKFEYIGNNKIRIEQKNNNSKLGFKYSRPIVLVFEECVIKDFVNAENNNNNKLSIYKTTLQKIIREQLQYYDADGDKGTAFHIEIDSRATDLQ